MKNFHLGRTLMGRTSLLSREIKYYYFKTMMDDGYLKLHKIEKCLPKFLFIP